MIEEAILEVGKTKFQKNSCLRFHVINWDALLHPPFFNQKNIILSRKYIFILGFKLFDIISKVCLNLQSTFTQPTTLR